MEVIAIESINADERQASAPMTTTWSTVWNLLLGPSRSHPRAGGGWAGPVSLKEGVGDGWSSYAAKAVRRSPGPPPSLIPKCPSGRRGAAGGWRWDIEANGLDPEAASSAANVT